MTPELLLYVDDVDDLDGGEFENVQRINQLPPSRGPRCEGEPIDPKVLRRQPVWLVAHEFWKRGAQIDGNRERVQPWAVGRAKIERIVERVGPFSMRMLAGPYSEDLADAMDPQPPGIYVWVNGFEARDQPLVTCPECRNAGIINPHDWRGEWATCPRCRPPERPDVLGSGTVSMPSGERGDLLWL